MPSLTRPISPRPFLSFGKDFSASPFSLKSPEAVSPHILVIGGGVTACVSAWILLDKGYKVTVVAKEFATFTKAQRLTSQIGAALCEFPSPPCGPRTSAENREKVRRWALESYETYGVLANEPKLASKFGVKFRKHVSFFPIPMEKYKSENERLIEMEKAGLQAFRHDANLLEEYQISKEEVSDAFECVSPVIDTDQAMKFLMDLLQSKGAVLLSDTIRGDLWENESRLLETYQVEAIVNASGLGARELASDKNVVPARGGLLRVINDGTDFEKIHHAMVVYNGEKSQLDKLGKFDKFNKLDKLDKFEKLDDLEVDEKLGKFSELDNNFKDGKFDDKIDRNFDNRTDGKFDGKFGHKFNQPEDDKLDKLNEFDSKFELDDKFDKIDEFDNKFKEDDKLDKLDDFDSKFKDDDKFDKLDKLDQFDIKYKGEKFEQLEKLDKLSEVDKMDKPDKLDKFDKTKFEKHKDTECDIIFIVPRNDNTLILGTIMELFEWDTDLTLESPIIQTMREKCERFVPLLKNARLDPEYPLAQGLRPLRKGDVRIEREPRMKGNVRSRIVHSYGHGIGGWTLAFGSGSEVALLVDQILEAK